MLEGKTQYKEKIEQVELPSLKYEVIRPALDRYGNKITSFQNFEKVVQVTRERGFNGETGFSLLVLIVSFFFYTRYPLICAIVVALIFIPLAIMKRRAKRSLKKYKMEVIQALYLDYKIAMSLDAENHIQEKEFNSSGFYKQANHLKGEDYIEGFTGDFHFKFSEVKAKYKKSEFQVKSIFSGLFFKGNWGVRPPLDQNFKLMKCRIKNSEEASFHNFFDFYDLEGKFLNQNKTKHLLSDETKEALLVIAKKYDYRFDIIFKQGEVFLIVPGAKDFFKIDLTKKFDENLYMDVVKDVSFFAELIQCFSSITGPRVDNLTLQ